MDTKKTHNHLIILLITICLIVSVNKATAREILIDLAHVVYLKNAILAPGDSFSNKELDEEAFKNVVNTIIVLQTSKTLETAGYIVVESKNALNNNNLLILTILVRVTRDFYWPCSPGKESEKCVPGIDLDEAGGIWDPKEAKYIVKNPVSADKLEIVFEIKRKNSKDKKIWSQRLSIFPCDKTGPIPVAYKDVYQLADKILKKFPKP